MALEQSIVFRASLDVTQDSVGFRHVIELCRVSRAGVIGVMNLREALRYPLAPVDRPQIDALERSLRDSLGPAIFESEWTVGSRAEWHSLMEDAAGAA